MKIDNTYGDAGSTSPRPKYHKNKFSRRFRERLNPPADAVPTNRAQRRAIEAMKRKEAKTAWLKKHGFTDGTWRLEERAAAAAKRKGGV